MATSWEHGMTAPLSGPGGPSLAGRWTDVSHDSSCGLSRVPCMSTVFSLESRSASSTSGCARAVTNVGELNDPCEDAGVGPTMDGEVGSTRNLQELDELRPAAHDGECMRVSKRPSAA
eukprot:364314-Chlamydomonas_euryale.AAC.16